MESNTWCPRLTAAMILLGCLVQMKGLGLALVSAMKSWIVSLSSWRERKTPRLRRRLDKSANKPSTALSQEAEVGVKWKTKRGWRASPFQHLGMLVRGVVVEDGVDGEFGRRSGIDNVEEADELLMAMAFHALADDLAFEDVESGEQGRGAVPFVVVGDCAGAPLLHRQARLGAVERLDLALLIDR